MYVLNRLAIVGLSVFVSLTSARAETIDLNVNDQAAMFRFSTYSNNAGYGNAAFNVGFLYDTDENVYFEGGVMVTGMAGDKTPGLRVGLGPKGVVAIHDAGNAYALALGIEAAYRFPTTRRFGISAQGFYAPSIVAYDDTERYQELEVRVEYDMLPTANVYLGYRRMRAHMVSAADFDVNAGGFLGFKITF